MATDLGAGFDPREVVFRGSNPSLEIPAGLLVPKASYLIKLSSARIGASQPHDASSSCMVSTSTAFEVLRSCPHCFVGVDQLMDVSNTQARLRIRVSRGVGRMTRLAALLVLQGRGWSSNQSRKCSYEQPTRVTVCGTMRSICGANADCLATTYQSLSASGTRATETQRGMYIDESALVAVIEGGNREVPRGARVVLDASLSHDPDASLAWRVARGEVASDTSNASLLLFTCPPFSPPGPLS